MKISCLFCTFFKFSSEKSMAINMSLGKSYRVTYLIPSTKEFFPQQDEWYLIRDLHTFSRRKLKIVGNFQ